MIQPMEATIHKFDDNHQYTIIDCTIHEVEHQDPEIGTLTLFNIVSGQEESYTIWSGDNDLSSFYVCLPTGGEPEDDDDDLDVYSLDEFNISLHTYLDLPFFSKLRAASEFEHDSHALFERADCCMYTAHQTLVNENNRHLYSFEGTLLSQNGMY